ncbi:hypothetical protein BEL01nite_48250 [Bradyrhizobium elkanii]|nr:hypothetical protein BEL01nite_48250 [Bradyrhizobium elkanii]
MADGNAGNIGEKVFHDGSIRLLSDRSGIAAATDASTVGRGRTETCGKTCRHPVKKTPRRTGAFSYL